jgi:acetyltransferase-like isoleucine patch superfamily enzyme
MSEEAKDESVKIKSVLNENSGSKLKQYINLTYGKVSMLTAFKNEFILSILSSWPGAVGLALRMKIYKTLFKSYGKKVFIGRNVTIRHPDKIRIGNNVILDDNCVIDAKGENNSGISIGDNVFIGRNSIVYCKNGDIHLKDKVNISSNCTVFSSNQLVIEEGTIIGAYSYLLSGGEYNFKDTEVPFADQSGMNSKGELRIGSNCWLAARVTVLDGSCIGSNCVLGAGAVVTKPLPDNSVAVGVPAKPV